MTGTGWGPRPRTAFVLAGGASLGALQVGMLRALYERGISPDFIVGTSAGALNAAYVASRAQTVLTASDLARLWCSLHRQDVFPIHPPTLIGGLGKQRDHIVPDRPLRRLISRHLQLACLEEAPIPVHVVTFDLLSGQEVRLSRGPALEAVLAAIAVPGVLPPVRWGEHLLVDGGVVNNTPISHAVELGAERIYVLPTADPEDLGLPLAPEGALDAAIHAFTLLVGSRLQADLARYAGAAELIVLPAAHTPRVQPTDFEHSHRLIASALTASREALSVARATVAIAA
ncbi:MAG: patatin-like phospholipase family protein [Solirubrobacterales bacterium]|nr:patatin-like phospholipase family protein [Solirubrobacterales bacterium]